MIASMIAIGVGYAAWTQSIMVTQSVSAGELSVKVIGYGNPNGEMSTVPGQETNINYFDFIGDDQPPYLLQNLPCTEISLGGLNYCEIRTNGDVPYVDVGLRVPEDEDSITIFIEDAIPGMEFGYDVVMKNVGSVPVALTNPIYPAMYVGAGDDPDLANQLLEDGVIEFIYNYPSGAPDWMIARPDGNGGTIMMNVVCRINLSGNGEGGEVVLPENTSLEYEIHFIFEQDVDGNPGTEF